MGSVDSNCSAAILWNACNLMFTHGAYAVKIKEKAGEKQLVLKSRAEVIFTIFASVLIYITRTEKLFKQYKEQTKLVEAYLDHHFKVVKADIVSVGTDRAKTIETTGKDPLHPLSKERDHLLSKIPEYLKYWNTLEAPPKRFIEYAGAAPSFKWITGHKFNPVELLNVGEYHRSGNLYDKDTAFNHVKNNLAKCSDQAILEVVENNPDRRKEILQGLELEQLKRIRDMAQATPQAKRACSRFIFFQVMERLARPFTDDVKDQVSRGVVVQRIQDLLKYIPFDGYGDKKEQTTNLIECLKQIDFTDYVSKEDGISEETLRKQVDTIVEYYVSSFLTPPDHKPKEKYTLELALEALLFSATLESPSELETSIYYYTKPFGNDVRLVELFFNALEKEAALKEKNSRVSDALRNRIINHENKELLRTYLQKVEGGKEQQYQRLCQFMVNSKRATTFAMPLIFEFNLTEAYKPNSGLSFYEFRKDSKFATTSLTVVTPNEGTKVLRINLDLVIARSPALQKLFGDNRESLKLNVDDLDAFKEYLSNMLFAAQTIEIDRLNAHSLLLLAYRLQDEQLAEKVAKYYVEKKFPDKMENLDPASVLEACEWLVHSYPTPDLALQLAYFLKSQIDELLQPDQEGHYELESGRYIPAIHNYYHPQSITPFLDLAVNLSQNQKLEGEDKQLPEEVTTHFKKLINTVILRTSICLIKLREKCNSEADALCQLISHYKEHFTELNFNFRSPSPITPVEESRYSDGNYVGLLFRALTHLRSLSLANGVISPETIQAIANHLIQLEDLDLTHCTIVGSSDEVHTKIRELEKRNINVKLQGMKAKV